MLQRIRDSLQGQKWLAYVILGALALVFAAWGAYGIVDLGFGPGNHAAKVNGDSVSLEEVREAWMQQQAQWQQRFGGELPEAQKTLLQNELLEAFVRNTLLNQKTKDLGYRVSDTQVHKAVESEPAFQIDGKYSPEVAKSALAQAGISPLAYEADLRSALQRAEVQNAIRASNFLTPKEFERLNALQNEQRQVRYALMPADKFAGDTPIDDAAIKQFYDKNQARFMTPESAKLAYAELRLDQLASQVTVTDQEAREYYDKNLDRYGSKEKRHAAHILISVPEGSKPEVDAAGQKEANDVMAKLKAGGDFAALAKEHSDDPGSASKGGELDWAERTTFVGPFADAVFSMKEGELRGPVKTQYGYHIIRLDGIQPGTTKAFADVRGEIDAQLRRDKASEQFGDIQEQIQSRLEQPGATLDGLAKEFNLQVGEVADFQRSAGGGTLGTSPELQETVFSDAVLAEKRIGGPVALGEDRIVLVKLIEHHKPAPKPIAEVRAQITDELKKERGTAEAVKAAQNAKQKLESGTSFDDVARELGVTAEAARFIGRDDPAVPNQIRQATFDAAKPAAGKPIVRTVQLDTGGAAVVQITDSRVDAGESNPQMQVARKRQVAAQQGMSDVSAYVQELRRTAKVVKNPQAFE
jgi:peptidyl-prolyl cis-trans isomerase D